MHAAVVTSPSWAGGALSLGTDVSLVKAGLLYADTVEVHSCAARLGEEVRAAAGAGHRQLVEFLQQSSSLVLQSLGFSSDFDPRRTDPAPGDLDRLDSIATGAVFPSSREAEYLEALMSSDSAFPKTSGFDLADIGTQGGAQAYGQLLGDIMDNPKLRPLFDQPVSALARGLQREGTLDPVDRAITHTRQAGVGAFLIARLPAFPDADVELLLEAKRDLTGPRNVFRAAVNQYAAEIQPLSWDGPDFEADLRDLHETVDLARIALVEALTATSLGRSIARALREPLGAAGATAAITVDMGSLVPALASLADHAEAVSSAIGGLSLSALAAAILGETGKAKATRQGLRTDELFYLVELDRRI